MYQPYPGAGQSPMPQQPSAPPQPVQNAVKCMYAGAALSAISLIIGLVTIHSLKSAIKSANPALTASQINTALGVAEVTAVIVGLLGIGLWIWMAMANRSGKNWARIMASVLFGINTLLLLLGLARPHALFSLLLSVLTWLAGLGAIIFLWNKESTSYFQAMSAPRY